MSYFNLLQNEQIINFNNLKIELAKIIENKMSLNNHKESGRIFSRWIDSVINELIDCDRPTLENWQRLIYSVYTQDRYEGHLSNLFSRFGHTCTNLDTVYKGLDIFSNEILSRAGFEDIENIPKIIFCGGNSYSNTLGMNKICFRATDVFRCWNWGILGHELGHTISRNYYDVISRTGSTARRRIRSGRDLSPEIIARNWTNEFVADIIGILTVGPSYLYSHMMNPRLWCFLPTDEGPLVEFFKTHPPDEVRYLLQNEVLMDLDMGDIISIDEISDIRTHVDLTSEESTEIETFEDKVEDIENMHPLTLDFFKSTYPSIKERIRFFSREDWERSIEVGSMITEGSLTLSSDLTITHIINGLVANRPSELRVDIESQLMRQIFETISVCNL